MFPQARCELNYSSPFELAIAVLLSAQCTDKIVNEVTELLFQKYKNAADYITVPLAELEQDIRRIGLYRNKSKHIKGMCRVLLDEYGGEIPRTLCGLISLPGVGRKTANVVLSNAFGVPAMAVDTHVNRVAKRLGIASVKDSVISVEQKITSLLPKEHWTVMHHRFIFFGRYHCTAKKPNCNTCPLLDMCPDGKKRMKKTKMTQTK